MVIACIFHLVVVAELSALVMGQWVYTWPYQQDGSCDCILDTDMPLSFATQEQCVEAFAEEDLEYCRHGTAGIVQQQCLSAVSIEEGHTNGDCANMCTRLVAGVVSTAEFSEVCKFEFVISFGDSVAVLPDSCFSNYVYGWSDFDAHSVVQTPPLRVLPEVSSPAKCQELCQLIPECVSFNWRALPESVSSLNGFQNAPETCILYDDAYINGVLAHTSSMAPTPYCNIEQVAECATPPWESTDHFSLFDDYKCLICGCQPKCSWLSGSHVTGPAFCETKTGRDACHYERPVWTTTLPPCEEPSTTEALEIGGTAETDFVRLHKAVKSVEVDTSMTSEAVGAETATAIELSTTESTTGLVLSLEVETETAIELMTSSNYTEEHKSLPASQWH